MTSKKDNYKHFPRLNFEYLMSWARRMANDIIKEQVDRIVLYGYSSPYRTARDKDHPVKYCVVFEIKDETPPIYDPDQAIEDIGIDNIPLSAWLPEEEWLHRGDECGYALTDREKEMAESNRNKYIAQTKKQPERLLEDNPKDEKGKDSIYSLTNYFETLPNEYVSLMENGRFADAYVKQPDKDFKREWFFVTGRLAEGNRGIIKEDLYVLFDSSEIECPPSASKKQASSESMIISGAENVFKRDHEFWTIRYEGCDSRPISHVDGLLYIAHLLNNPEKSFPCKDLYQTTKGCTLSTVMDSAKAISQGLSLGSSSQEIADFKAKADYAKRIRELKGDLEKADSDLERREIEDEITSYLSFLKERHFNKPEDKKAQTNVVKRIKGAYKKLRDSGFTALIDHLEKSIRSDGSRGLLYCGSKKWEIFF